MLVVASSNYLYEIQKDKYVISQNDMPRVSIPFLHIVKEEMKERISFVKDAITEGFYLGNGHLICPDISLSNPKTYFTLKNIDFDLFETILQECWKKVVTYMKNPDSLKLIDFVKKSRYLVVENMFLFHKDFSNELIHLRFFYGFPTMKLTICLYCFCFQMQMACCRDGCNICYEFARITRFPEFDETLPGCTKIGQLVTDTLISHT